MKSKPPPRPPAAAPRRRRRDRRRRSDRTRRAPRRRRRPSTPTTKQPRSRSAPRDVAAGATDVEHARPGAHRLDDPMVRRERRLLLGVLGHRRVRVLGRCSRPASCRRNSMHALDYVLGVLEAVDVRDLVAVVGRDRHLLDAEAARLELDDDLRVEVEVVAVGFERDLRQRRRPSRRDSRSGTRSGSCRARRSRTGSGPGCRPTCTAACRPRSASRLFIMREPNTASASPSRMRLDEPRHLLGRVLPVAVQQHDDVVAAIDRVAVAELLVAAVAVVARVADDLQRHRPLVR